jgi:hypothetical protein
MMENISRKYLKLGSVFAVAGALIFLARLVLAVSSGRISAGDLGADAVVALEDDPRNYYLQLLLEFVRLAGCIILLVVLLLRIRKGRTSGTS